MISNSQFQIESDIIMSKVKKKILKSKWMITEAEKGRKRKMDK